MRVLLVVAATVVITAICLWLFFRSGSVADRARSDDDADLNGG